jgi:hypothetical protein
VSYTNQPEKAISKLPPKSRTADMRVEAPRICEWQGKYVVIGRTTKVCTRKLPVLEAILLLPTSHFLTDLQ